MAHVLITLQLQSILLPCLKHITRLFKGLFPSHPPEGDGATLDPKKQLELKRRFLLNWKSKESEQVVKDTAKSAKKSNKRKQPASTTKGRKKGTKKKGDEERMSGYDISFEVQGMCVLV